jgi:hypothetical protein
MFAEVTHGTLMRGRTDSIRGRRDPLLPFSRRMVEMQLLRHDLGRPRHQSPYPRPGSAGANTVRAVTPICQVHSDAAGSRSAMHTQLAAAATRLRHYPAGLRVIPARREQPDRPKFIDL